MMLLTDLADACRKADLHVTEVAGWQSRGHGSMAGVRTVVCHHTAGPATGEAPSLNYIRDNGLSQLVLGRSGTVYVVAAGICWHAGVVHRSEWSNSYSIGIEAEATGRDAWSDVQYESYARLCAALVEHYGLSVADVRGHKEVAAPAGRKIDPNFDMDQFRVAVSNAMESDMFTDADRAKLDTLARRVDVGFSRDQILTRLGVENTEAYPTDLNAEELAAIEPARRVDVGYALQQILSRLDAIEAKLP